MLAVVESEPPSGSPDLTPFGIPTGDLFTQLYGELRRLASHRMAREKPGQTLQPTALVNEVWLRLSAARKQDWPDEAAFIAAASETMRRILVDRARGKQAVKNGGQWERAQAELADLPELNQTSEEMLLIHEHLEKFARSHPERAQLLELHFFAGLGFQQIAALTGESLKTVQRRWQFAKVWLYESIERQGQFTKMSGRLGGGHLGSGGHSGDVRRSWR